jgi:DNA-binding NtrC family response regulator
MGADPAFPALAPPAPPPAPGFHGAVSEFKRRLIEATLHQAGGNRTRAARALGLQRTYLLRLIRELHVRIPPGAIGRTAAAAPARPKHVDTRGSPV